jgi:hypothetical protein
LISQKYFVLGRFWVRIGPKKRYSDIFVDFLNPYRKQLG